MDSETLDICGGLPPVDIEANYDTSIEGKNSGGNMRIKRAFGTPSLYWPQHSTLKIAFLFKNKRFQEIFKSAVEQWTPHINLKIEYVTDPTQAQIRVADQSEDPGNWSRIGADALNAPADEATMQLDLRQAHNIDTWISYILHEFGHALGLQHEHQHPDANIDWNTSAVYRICKEKNGWSKEMTHFNIFKKLKNIEALGPYDQSSIMHYGFCKAVIWKGEAITKTWTLSEKDKQLISSIYPPT
ncbi:M12 family metallopeptidase [Pseudomonas sp. WJP1]|uniref:M12 family metallopeptidase n=1 Tax=Pseudomonas sp. WJP1 TaxID=2986947 RepID=UPI00234B8E81|nr:M12 family metallopeptidase [Pseudomonas sp. WJP1]WCM52471.1 M12 family metallopeptidase [Pseudomonas sp. WJP1]